MHARKKLYIDGVLLLAAPVACLSGLVLFFAFHIGEGGFRPQALGLSRLAWQNIHRFAAALALVSAVAHAAVNAKPLLGRSLRALRGRPARQDVHELAVYATNATVFVTGFCAWLVIGGSMPIVGPVRLGRVAAERHPWIDVHNLAALCSLFLTTNHVRKRWCALATLVRRARVPRGQMVSALRPHHDKGQLA
jgi:hypothetical protein